MFTRFILQLQLHRQLRLRRQLTTLERRLDLKNRFPEHGRQIIGDIEILRFDADGGVDLKAFMLDHAGKPRTQKFFTLMPDAVKIASAAPAYIKPRIEKVKVSELQLSR